MAERHVVVISRAFTPGAPIAIDVTNEAISIRMPLSDFLAALATEIGSPAFLFRQAALLDELTAASATVCEKMKDETAPIMSR